MATRSQRGSWRGVKGVPRQWRDFARGEPGSKTPSGRVESSVGEDMETAITGYHSIIIGKMHFVKPEDAIDQDTLMQALKLTPEQEDSLVKIGDGNKSLIHQLVEGVKHSNAKSNFPHCLNR